MAVLQKPPGSEQRGAPLTKFSFGKGMSAAKQRKS
jgi:hypothetical protein